MIKLISVSAIALALLVPAHAQTERGPIYRCVAKEAVSLQNNGTLSKDAISESHRRYLDGIVIDTLTGAVTLRGNRAVWTIIRKGDDLNDHVLTSATLGPDAKQSALSAATNFFRLRAWKSEPQAKFLAFFELFTVVTGTCEIVR